MSPIDKIETYLGEVFRDFPDTESSVDDTETLEHVSRCCRDLRNGAETGRAISHLREIVDGHIDLVILDRLIADDDKTGPAREAAVDLLLALAHLRQVERGGAS